MSISGKDFKSLHNKYIVVSPNEFAYSKGLHEVEVDIDKQIGIRVMVFKNKIIGRKMSTDCYWECYISDDAIIYRDRGAYLVNQVVIKEKKLTKELVCFSDYRKYNKKMRNIPRLLRFVNPTIENYEKICDEAVTKSNGYAMKWVNPDYITNYNELCNIVTNKHFCGFKFIMPEKIHNYEILCIKRLINDNINHNALADIKVSSVVNYKLLCELALHNNKCAIEFVDYKKVPEYYNEVCMKFVTEDKNILRYINPDGLEDYEKVCTLAVKTYRALAFGYVHLNKVSNYNELCGLIKDKCKYILENHMDEE